MQSSSGVRIVAALEAAKGGLVLLAGFGLLALVHRNAQAVAESLVERSHLNPASRYPRIFIEAAGALTDARLWLLAAGASAYAVVRFVEAYGLWRRRWWAEWFAVLSGGIYVPIEIYEVARGASWPKLAALIVNLAIIAYMGRVLIQTRRSAREKAT